MALEKLSALFGQGGTGLAGQGADTLFTILKELRGISVGVYAGVGAGTDITIASMAAVDTIVAVIDLTTPSNLLPTDFVPKAGKLTSINATTGKNLLVVWFNKA